MGSGCFKQSSHSNPNVNYVRTRSNPAATPKNVTAVRAAQPTLESNPADDGFKGEKVTNPTIAPYKWICTLEIKTTKGTSLQGTGFKIRFPGINQGIILTAAHLIFVDSGDSIANITITFPGQKPFTVNLNSAAIFPSAMYTQDPQLRWSYDYGMIALPNMNSDEGFGWSCVVPENVLVGCNVTVCGYSKNRDWPQMWKVGEKIKRVNADQISYENFFVWLALQGDGTPVCMMYKGNWTVVGIDSVHNTAGITSGVYRFNNIMIRDLIEKSQNLKKYALRSVQWPDLYIHCDGKDVNQASSNYKKEGEINCQYKPPSDSETFYIYPVEVPPLSAQEQKYIVVLQSAKWPNLFVHMDASGMTQPVGFGGGVVNCQWQNIYYDRATSLEAFDFKKDAIGQYYFQSVQFPNCYIRFKGTGVTSPTDNGGGVVNCQYYYTENDVTSWEKFHLEPQ